MDARPPKLCFRVREAAHQEAHKIMSLREEEGQITVTCAADVYCEVEGSPHPPKR